MRRIIIKLGISKDYPIDKIIKVKVNPAISYDIVVQVEKNQEDKFGLKVYEAIERINEFGINNTKSYP